MSVITTNQERQFVNTYLELISLSKQEPATSFYNTSDYSKLSSLGPSLPKYNYKFPESQTSNSEDVTYLLKFKSLKPPFKFSTDITLTSNESIYKIKTLLIQRLKQLQTENVTPNDIKLLYKSKVLQDSVTIDSLGNTEISFNCMISSSGNSKTTNITNTDDDPDISQPISNFITDSSWDKIYEIVQADLKDDTRSKGLIDKFKQQI